MATTPSWKAAQNGLPGNLEATNHATQIGQLLGTHDITPIYQGNSLVIPDGDTNFAWVYPGVAYDFDQPFTLPSGDTQIGRIAIPILPVGNGADLIVSLCPDSSGSPNTSDVLSQTMIPAAWINNLLASDGLTGAESLATAQFNALAVDNPQTTDYGTPISGLGYLASVVVSGNYMILLGGLNLATTGYTQAVNVIPYIGNGAIGSSIGQPQLPETLSGGMAAATSNAVIYAGGSNFSASVSDVWVAPWNPDTGVVGAWSSQPSLPTVLVGAGCAAWGDTVYIVGGDTGSSSLVLTDAVWYATITNNQFTAWEAGPSYPHTVNNAAVVAVNGWLVAVGGDNGTTVYDDVWYAKINTDGSLGSWRQGPSVPVAVTNANGIGTGYAYTDNSVILVEGYTTANGSVPTNAIQTLTFTADGPGAWQRQTFVQSTSPQAAAWPDTNGQWRVFSFIDGEYISATVKPMPLLSVPLPATGLTGGDTYHVLLQQSGGDEGINQVGLGFMKSALPSSTLYRSRGSTGAWFAYDAGWSIPVTVYDQTSGGQILHTWQDPDTNNAATATSTIVSDYRSRLLGYLEATTLPNDPLNQNTLTTSSTSPWTVTNCTLAASTAETHGGYAYSGLMTPNGTSATVYVSSELLPVTPSEWYTASGWLYSTPGYSNVSLSVNWFDHAGTYLSTSSRTVSLTAATWTQVTNVFQAPAGAAQAQLVPTEGGTPTASDALYLSDITLTAVGPTSLASVAQVDYPSGGVWPPIEVTQVA